MFIIGEAESQISGGKTKESILMEIDIKKIIQRANKLLAPFRYVGINNMATLIWVIIVLVLFVIYNTIRWSEYVGMTAVGLVLAYALILFVLAPKRILLLKDCLDVVRGKRSVNSFHRAHMVNKRGTYGKFLGFSLLNFLIGLGCFFLCFPLVILLAFILGDISANGNSTIYQLLLGLFIARFMIVVPFISLFCFFPLTTFILKDNPDITVVQAMKLDKTLMRGNRAKFFGLCSKYIGWYILCLLSIGIASIWARPYFYSSVALFYDEITKIGISRKK